VQICDTADYKSALLPRPALSHPQSSILNPQSSITLAFSLVEILVAVALMSFIVLGLLLMFNQTQRVFNGGMAQQDIMESGRAVMSMVVADLQQVTPSQVPGTINFFARNSPLFNPPLRQGLPGTATLRANSIQTLFFVTQYNLDWTGIGYQVLEDSPGAACVGALYRYTTNTTRPNASDLSRAFLNAPPNSPNLRRIADGIVHFRVQAFATNGFPLVPYPVGNPQATRPLCFRTNSYSPWTVFVKGATNDAIAPENSYFVSNAVPAYLDFELGVLEPKTLERFKSIGDRNAQRAYLSNHAAQVHIFRQRIPIRNVDPTAYVYP
jgi:hypothetical protein